MDIKNFFSKIGAKKIYLALGGVLFVAIVAGAMFLPGTLFRGALPLGSVFRCIAEPSTAVKGSTVKWIAQLKPAVGEFAEIDANMSNYTVFWTGDVGENGEVMVGENPTINESFSSTINGFSVTVTYPDDYKKNTASAKATLVTKFSGDNTLIADCSVQLLDEPITISTPENGFFFEFPKTDATLIEMPSTTEDTTKLPSSKIQNTLSCSPNVSKTETGESVEWKAVLSPAVKGVKYTWTGDGIKTITTDTGTLEITYSTAGNKSAYVTVSNGSSGLDLGTSETLTEDCGSVKIVEPAPLEVNCAASPNPAKVGEDVIWTATAKGGVGPYEYVWYDSSDPSVNGKTTQSVTTSYSAVDASKTVNLIVTDTNGDTDGATCEPLNVVEAPPIPDPLAVACSVAPNTIESGDTVTWTADATGGNGSYSYLWSGDKINGKTTKSVQAVFDQKPLTNSFEVRVESGTQSRTVTCPKLTYLDTTQDEEEEAEIGELSKCPGLYYPSDIEGHWAEDYIKRGYDYCLFKGVGGKFFPDRQATRIEAASMILYSKDKKPSATCTTLACLTPFNDLQNKDQGAILNPLYFESLIEGYPNNQFRPQSLITRAEAASLIVRTFFEPFGRECYDPHCGAGWPDNFFTDITETWQGKYIRVLWDLRIMTGSGPNRVEPNRSITRAEMAKMIVLAYEETH